MNGETDEADVPVAPRLPRGKVESTGGGAVVGAIVGDWASTRDDPKPPASIARARNDGQAGLFFQTEPARFMGSSKRSKV